MLCSAHQGESFGIQHVLDISISVFLNLSADVSSRKCKAASIVPSRFQQGPFDSTFSVDYDALNSSRNFLFKGKRWAGELWKNLVVSNSTRHSPRIRSYFAKQM